MGLAYSFRDLVLYPHGGIRGIMQAAMVAQSSTSRSEGIKERESLDLAWAFEISKQARGDTLPPIRPQILLLSNGATPW